jgi:hypothetical protein
MSNATHRAVTPVSQPPQAAPTANVRTLQIWPRWVAANALAEMIGLGLSGLLAVRLVFADAARWGVLTGALITIVLSTLLEGSSVGWFQWRVLRHPLPALSLHAWWLGTAFGAFVAWTLGMLPSTLMNMAEASGAAPTAGPSQTLTLLLAAGLGAVAGPILGVGQWWVLRNHVARAWRWIPAQSLAWAAGMPIIFQMMDWIAPGAFTPRDALIAVAMLLLTGGVVGALHGWVLVRMVRDETAGQPR